MRQSLFLSFSILFLSLIHHPVTAAGTGAVPSSAIEPVAITILPANCRVFPVGEESPDLGEKQLRQLKHKSAVWDSEAKTIHLAAARQETVSFQIVARKTGTDEPQIEIKASELKGANGAEQPAGIRLFLAGYVEDGGKFYPDILVPFSAGGVTPFSIPHRVERLAAVPGQENQTVWVDVDVPAKTRPGLYRGTLSVAARVKDVETIQSFALELSVSELTLPLTRSVNIVLDDYSGVVKGLKLDNQPDAMIDIERRFYKLAHEHRMFINVIRYSQNGLPQKGRLPDFSRNEKGELVADWTFFDKRFGPYLDGSAFDDGVPIEQFCLYFNAYWPGMMWPKADHPDPKSTSKEKVEYENRWMEYAGAYIKHFKEQGWDKVTYTIKMNHYIKRTTTFPLLWNIDTPKTPEDFRAAAYFADLTHRAFADLKPLTLRYRMDSAHSFCREAGCPNTVWNDCHADEIMNAVDFWFFEWEHGLSHRSKLKEMKARGKQVYIYKHGWTCAEASPIFSGLGWLLWAAGVDGYNAWNHPCDADENLLKTHREGGMWDNYTMFPGWAGDKRDAFPSIRLKLQRNSLFDYEYIKLASAKDPARTEATVARLVKFGPLPADSGGRHFSGPILAPDPIFFDDAKRDLIAILEQGNLSPPLE